MKTFPVLSAGFEIETEMTIHAVSHNLLIDNVVVDYRDRPEGSASKLNTVSDGTKVLCTIMRLFRSYRPSLFFGLLSLFLMIVAGGMFLPVLLKFIATHRVPNFPTLIVSGFIALAAIQSFFAGLILSDRSLQERRDFEMKYLAAWDRFQEKQ